MSIVTTPKPRVNADKVSVSQLPFGFEVDCYFYGCGKTAAEHHKSQLPFGFDVDCYAISGDNGLRELRLMSQLPFGFDVDCYSASGSGCRRHRARSQLPFGFDVDCYCTIFLAFVQ